MAQTRTLLYALTTTSRRALRPEAPASARRVCTHPDALLVSLPNSKGEGRGVPAMICVECGETLAAWGHFLG